MRIGVDSYSYHRFFGELRTSESPAEQRWTTDDFLNCCSELGVDGVSLETCFLDSGADADVESLRQRLDQHGFERVLAWGHPDGLAMGLDRDAFADALAAVDQAAGLGCNLLRIVIGTTRHFGHEDETEVLRRVVPQLAQITEKADLRGLDVAIETHCDLTTESVGELIEQVASPQLGVVFDSANVVRIGDDLLTAAAALAPHTKMIHAKDLDLGSSTPGNPGGHWPGVPLGHGDLDIDQALAVMNEAGFDGLACIEVADMAPGWSEHEIVAQSVDWLTKFATERYSCPE
ncbi:sugar phosphate isomerase/epimerase family protein [Candidatus Poriferisocius sp.]|uniref:sugar phosphate isomerase/epimerase family protein n=1 Tax=Candidatus Poriferisocius sp. TaxID=3101276 RepID=UPI003B0163FD